GDSTLELLTKHCCEPIIPPETRAQRVPRQLSNVVLKMLEKQREDRYPTLGPVIRELEQFLGIQAGGPFSPREEHLTKLEACARRFQTPTAKLRDHLYVGFAITCVLVGVLSLLLGAIRLAFAVAIVTVTTSVAAFVLKGFVYYTPLFCKMRELARAAPWT